jgi:hypothetical protein
MAYLVNISLDEESHRAFQSIPRGKRSKHIRALLGDAEALSEAVGLNEAMMIRIHQLKRERKEARWQLEQWKAGMVDAGWISPESQREDAKRIARIMGDEE